MNSLGSGGRFSGSTVEGPYSAEREQSCERIRKEIASDLKHDVNEFHTAICESMPVMQALMQLDRADLLATAEALIAIRDRELAAYTEREFERRADGGSSAIARRLARSLQNDLVNGKAFGIPQPVGAGDAP